MVAIQADRRSAGGFALPAAMVSTVGLMAWVAFMYIRLGSVDVVYSDTWGYLRMIDGFLSGAFDPWEIVRPHNQNRSVVLSIALLGSAVVDRFNQKDIMYVSILFVVLNAGSLLFLAYIFLRARPVALSMVSAAIGLCLFSLIQWENYLLSINFVFFSTVAFSVVAIIAMSRYLTEQPGAGAWKTFLAAAILSELALFSMGGGVAVWAVNFVQIALAITLFRVPASGALTVYGALGLASLGLYVRGLDAGGSLTVALAHPLDALAFFVIGSGNSIVGFFSNAPWLTLDFVVGLALLGVYGYVFVHFARLPRDEQKRSLVLVCLLLLGLVEQALLVYGRLQLGVANAATARYSTLTMVSPAAALLFLTVYAEHSRVCLWLAAIAGTAIVAFALIGDRNEWAMMPARQAYQRNLQELLRRPVIGPEEAIQLEWDRLSDIRDGTESLKRQRLSLFKGP